MCLSHNSINDLNTRGAERELHRDVEERTVFLAQVKTRRCKASYERLYQYYAPRICAFLRQKGADERISQEIMQDVMTRVWHKADQFDEKKSSASAWIFAIARNRFIDVIRQSKRSEVDPNDPLLAHREEPAPDSRLQQGERISALKAAISELPGDQAEVLQLVYLSGMTQQTAADRLSIPLNTVKSRLRLALEKLRRRMEYV